MQYSVVPFLIDLLEKDQKRMVRVTIFGLIVFIAYSILIYFRGNKGFGFEYFLSEIVFALFTIYIQKWHILPRAKTISSTSTLVTVSKTQIVIITPPCKILFWVNKRAEEIIFDIDKMAMTRISYPIPNIFDIDKGVIKLKQGKKEALIIANYFDIKLVETLRDLKPNPLAQYLI